VLARPRRVLRRVSESIETLSLDDDLREDMLASGARPVGPLQLRLWLIRLSRELARDYREQHGVELRTDAITIERMQRHLHALANEARAGNIDARTLSRELVRHGALFGEILARSLDATWVDLDTEIPMRWRMLVAGVSIYPIAQAHRFVQQANRERDLVAVYLDLHAAQRLART
jgi:hypothetical protein